MKEGKVNAKKGGTGAVIIFRATLNVEVGEESVPREDGSRTCDLCISFYPVNHLVCSFS